jgi:hypothetical protein
MCLAAVPRKGPVEGVEGPGRGCIGIVMDVLGKRDLRENTECFHFSDPQKAKEAANIALKNKKCKPCHHPMMFAYRYWAPSTTPPEGPILPPVLPPRSEPNPNYDPHIPFDFCVRMSEGFWWGAPEVHKGYYIWPDFESFAGAYGPDYYDNTVVCVTCTGDYYMHGGFLGLFPHFGPCTIQQLKNLEEHPRPHYDPFPLPVTPW